MPAIKKPARRCGNTTATTVHVTSPEYRRPEVPQVHIRRRQYYRQTLLSQTSRACLVVFTPRPAETHRRSNVACCSATATADTGATNALRRLQDTVSSGVDVVVLPPAARARTNTTHARTTRRTTFQFFTSRAVQWSPWRWLCRLSVADKQVWHACRSACSCTPHCHYNRAPLERHQPVILQTGRGMCV